MYSKAFTFIIALLSLFLNTLYVVKDFSVSILIISLYEFSSVPTYSCIYLFDSQ